MSQPSRRWVSCAPCVLVLLTREVAKTKDDFQPKLSVVQHLSLRARRQRHVMKTYFMPKEFGDNKENLHFLSSHPAMSSRVFWFCFLIKKQLLVFIEDFCLS